MAVDSRIREYITSNGYITIDRLMQELLTENIDSYYKSDNILGCSGDFVTSPEISQLFGEILGLWAIEQWQNIGEPSKINIVELGAGNGLLMRDMLRVAKLVPKFYAAISVEIMEINSYFVERQKDILSEFDISLNHIIDIENIKNLPSIFVANEFFDAMPVKQYVNIKGTWHELVLVTDPLDAMIKFDKIAVKNILQDSLCSEHPKAMDGAVLEESYSAMKIMKFMCQHLARRGGSSIIIDYGYDIGPDARTTSQYNPTLQAVKNHEYRPILEIFGEADISAHVDFFALKTIARGLGISTNFTSQRNFLIQYGILLRGAMLKKSLSMEESLLIEKQISRLISKNQMGELFKVLICSHKIDLLN